MVDGACPDMECGTMSGVEQSWKRPDTQNPAPLDAGTAADHLPDAAKKVYHKHPYLPLMVLPHRDLGVLTDTKASAHLPCVEGSPALLSWAVPAFSLPVDPVEFWAGVLLVGWWICT